MARKKARKKATPSHARRRRASGARSTEVRRVVVIPVRNLILFPGVPMPLMVGRDSSIRALQTAVQAGEPVALLLQRSEETEDPTPEDLYEVGTLAEILRFWTAPDGRHQAICQGSARFRVLRYLEQEPLLVAEVAIVPTDEPETREVEARAFALRQSVQELLHLAPGAPEGFAQEVQAMSPSLLADTVACMLLDAPASAKQELLETYDLVERLDKIQRMLADHIEVMRLSAKIREDTKGALDKAQREYYLREHLRAIQRELGEEEATSELEHLRERLAALQLPAEARAEVDRELRRLTRMPEQSAEYPMLRTWLDVVAALPWSEATADRIDLDEAERILDEDHFGLDKVKQRILEFLAVQKLNPGGGGRTLCFVGPPGVGKTSLGKSIARAMGRAYVRASLGGVHDEAEIRGHRRTYVGAMPGKVLEGFKRAGSRNPVFVLDELDKLGAGLHGDPSAALLEVLDPAQNHSFRDNYLGVDFDVSRALFLGTANVLEAIPRALRDRLEIVHIPGYTEGEKVEIARRHLVGRCLERTGLDPARCRIRIGALRELVRHYTREAGVRGLEREIEALCRHAATLFARRRRRPVTIDAAAVREIRGPRRYEPETVRRTRTPGVATGLAWTPVGGELLFLEASRAPGKGRLVLTGQLGDVMKESAQAALSLVKARAGTLGLDPQLFEESDLHLHVPAGAVPKDGPSAGVALFVALVSLLTGRPVRHTVAMTGEISLRGLVLPVGGVKEKLLAAAASGLRRVLLPARNESDLEDVPEEVRRKLDLVLLEDVDQALAEALEG